MPVSRIADLQPAKCVGLFASQIGMLKHVLT